MADTNKRLIDLIKRQTDYTEEVIVEKLALHENNIENIILEYNGVYHCNKPVEKNITTNQKIFKAIRNNMNEISLNKKSNK
tara:strand:- start:3637 stop:3879 length:243 start_codon:yes stop_codon:yes gene_type:complete